MDEVPGRETWRMGIGKLAQQENRRNIISPKYSRTIDYCVTPKILLTAFTMSLICGKAAISSDFAYGIGVSTPAIRITGASR